MLTPTRPLALGVKLVSKPQGGVCAGVCAGHGDVAEAEAGVLLSPPTAAGLEGPCHYR